MLENKCVPIDPKKYKKMFTVVARGLSESKTLSVLKKYQTVRGTRSWNKQNEMRKSLKHILMRTTANRDWFSKRYVYRHTVACTQNIYTHSQSYTLKLTHTRPTRHLTCPSLPSTCSRLTTYW